MKYQQKKKDTNSSSFEPTNNSFQSIFLMKNGQQNSFSSTTRLPKDTTDFYPKEKEGSL
jgi:hypothetical protein